MKKHPSHELPIRSKLEMLKDIFQILRSFHLGQREELDRFVRDLKTRSVFLDEQIQQDVLIFAEAVQFQYEYDPWHKITPDIERSANRLIEDMGFSA